LCASVRVRVTCGACVERVWSVCACVLCVCACVRVCEYVCEAWCVSERACFRRCRGPPSRSTPCCVGRRAEPYTSSASVASHTPPAHRLRAIHLQRIGCEPYTSPARATCTTEAHRWRIRHGCEVGTWSQGPWCMRITHTHLALHFPSYPSCLGLRGIHTRCERKYRIGKDAQATAQYRALTETDVCAAAGAAPQA